MVDALRTRLEEACDIFSRSLVCHTSVALLAKGPRDKFIAARCAYRCSYILSKMVYADSPSEIVPVRADGMVLGRRLLY